MDGKVSINILHFNTYDKTRTCILSCLGQLGIKCEIVVIDNCSTDDSLEKLKKEFGNTVTFLKNNENCGYARGNNLGIGYCLKRGIEYSLILNSDTELIGNCLLRDLADIAKMYQNCVVVAPQIFNVTSKGFVLNRNDSFYLKLMRCFKILPPNRRINENCVYISEAQGSALLVENRMFLKLGGFPEHYYMYGEESLFAKKALWHKKRLIWYRNEHNYVLHHHDKSQKIDGWRLYLMGRNRTLEYYENRKQCRIRWTILFVAFHIYLLLKDRRGKGYRAYFEGMHTAKKMYRMHATKDDYYQNGQNAKEYLENRL